MTKDVTLACVYIDNFKKQNTVKQELHSKFKECGSKWCKSICDIFPKSKTHKKANVKV